MGQPEVRVEAVAQASLPPGGHAVTLTEFARLTAPRTTRDPAPATTGGPLPRRRARTAPTVPAPRGEHREQPRPRS
ncbi:hypothetical protein GCM10009602_43850 [Nocardiopsis tropica]